MKRLLALFRWEMRALLVSPARLFVGALFLLLLSGTFLLNLNRMALQPEWIRPLPLFMDHFWLPLLLLIPALTATSLGPDRRRGSLVGLLSVPLSTAEIVGAKFLSLLTYQLLLWLLWLVLISVAQSILGLPPELALYGPWDRLLCLTFLSIVSATYLSLGLLASVVLRDEAAAGGLTFILLTALTLAPKIPNTATAGGFSGGIVDVANVYDLLDEIRTGIFDLQKLVFYFSLTVLLLIMASLMVRRMERS